MEVGHNVLVSSPCWDLLTKTFPAVLSYREAKDEKRRKDLKLLLESLFSKLRQFKGIIFHNETRLIEQGIQYADEDSGITAYLYFCIRLFGQMLAVLLLDEYAVYFDNCVDVQIHLLNFLYTCNRKIYTDVVNCYMKAFTDVVALCSCKIIDDEAVGKFRVTQRFSNWFECPLNIENIKLNPFFYSFTSCNGCFSVRNKIAQIMKSQLKTLSIVNPKILLTLLETGLTMLEYIGRCESDSCVVYDYVSALVELVNFPSHFPSEGNILLSVFEQIYQIHWLPKGYVSAEKAFCSMIKAFTKRISADFSSSIISDHFHFLFTFLVQNCNAQVSYAVEVSITEFVGVIVDLLDFQDVPRFEAHYPIDRINFFIGAVERIIIRDMEEANVFSDDGAMFEVYHEIEIWRTLVDKAGNILLKVEQELKRNRKDNLKLYLKVLNSLSNCAANINSEAKTRNVKTHLRFFDGQIFNIGTKLYPALEKSFFDRSDFATLLPAIGNIMSLSEYYESFKVERYSLSFLLELPWYGFQNGKNTFPTFCDIRDNCDDLYLRYFTYLDKEMRALSLKYMVSAGSLYYTDWWLKFFLDHIRSRYYNLDDISSLLPLFVFYATSETIEELFDVVDNLDNEQSQVNISRQMRLLLCALSSKSYRSKSITIRCRLCDGVANSNAKNDYLVFGKIERREDLVTQLKDNFQNSLIILLKRNVREVTDNVLGMIPFISKHASLNDFSLLMKYCRSREMYNNAQAARLAPKFLNEPITNERQKLIIMEEASLWMKQLRDDVVKFITQGKWNELSAIIRQLYFIANDKMVVPFDALYKICCHIFVFALLTSPSPTNNCAESYLFQISESRESDETEVLIKYGDQFAETFANVLVWKRKLEGGDFNLENWLNGFDSRLVDNSFRNILKYVISYVVKYPELRCILRDIASIRCANVQSLVLQNFKSIFAHIIYFEDPSNVGPILDIISEETSTPIINLYNGFSGGLITELLLHSHEDERKCDIGLAMLEEGSSIPIPSQRINSGKIVKYVEQRCLPILMVLERNLTVSASSEYTRVQSIRALTKLIAKLDSSFVTSVRYKILVTLRMTLSSDDTSKLLRDSLICWECFVRKMELAALGPLLSTICSSILPFARTDNGKILAVIYQILRYAIVENETNTREYIAELYFVSPDECPDDVYKIIIRRVRYMMEKPLNERLSWLLQLTNHDVIALQLHALTRLKMELAKHRLKIAQLTLASASVHPIIVDILKVLIRACRDRDSRIQQASADCLGEIGAIDPSYLPNDIARNKEDSIIDIENSEFALIILVKLARGLHSAKEAFLSESFAIALQTVLKLYRVKKGEVIWQKMSENLRETVTPFFNSNYAVIGGTKIFSVRLPHPIFGSNCGETLHTWAYNWSCVLSRMLNDNSLAKDLFVNCTPAIQSDEKCALFFLPRILYSAVKIASDSQLTLIYEEIDAALRQTRLPIDYENQNSVKTNQSKIRTIVKPDNKTHSIRKANDEEARILMMKTVLNLIDSLRTALKRIRDSNAGVNSSVYKRIKELLDKFPKDMIAMQCIKCNEYSRSILYLEEHIDEHPSQSRSYYPVLSVISQNLNDVDSLKGVYSLQGTQSGKLKETITLHEMTEQYHDAILCYEKLLENSKEKEALECQENIIRCYMAIDEPSTAMRFIDTIISDVGYKKQTKFCDSIFELKCEALTKLSNFETARKIAPKQSSGWSVKLVTLMGHLMDGNIGAFRGQMEDARRLITRDMHNCIVTTTSGGYRESYQYIIKLHMLSEVEKIGKLVLEALVSEKLDEREWISKLKNLATIEFDERLSKLQPIGKVLQPVISLRQTVFTLANHVLAKSKPHFASLFDEQVKKCWIKKVEFARRTRNFQLAYSYILRSECAELKGLFTQKAMYYWDKQECNEALKLLHDGIKQYFPNSENMKKIASDERVEDRMICAEALCLIGSYNDQMAYIEPEANTSFYLDAMNVFNCCEKYILKYACHINKINDVTPIEKYTKVNIENCKRIASYYGKSLEYGCEFIYLSMARMLSVWLDTTQHLLQSSTFSKSERQKYVSDFEQIVVTWRQHIPTYYFLVSFSQLISRINHPCAETFDLLRSIIVDCVVDYSNQALWRFMSLHKSSSELGSRYNLIISHPKLKNLRLIKTFQELIEDLSEICDVTVRHGPTTLEAILKDKNPSTRLLKNNCNDRFATIMIPAQQFLTVALPNVAEETDSPRSFHEEFEPFPRQSVYIRYVRSKVHVYASLQKPRLITFVGTDGHDYHMILKPKDDLQNDCRMMEFNSIVNTYLNRSSEARDRYLHVRTYSVIPLMNKCGLIEFIPNLHSMGQAITSIYSKTEVDVSKMMLFKFEPSDTLDKKRKVYLEEMVPTFPTVLHEWYKTQFPDPNSWYTARSAYVRSAAVMSIVGYIIGLGDRHTENILLDSENGDIVHVDFNLLFNRSEDLFVPEIVPFRLTRNMIHAMGIAGLEGMFRYSFEITNKILRERKDQILSVFNHLLFHPMVKNTDKNATQKAKTILRDIEARLVGCVRKNMKNSLNPLSVEGQTRALIEEATSVDNLCQMYYGWKPYI